MAVAALLHAMAGATSHLSSDPQIVEARVLIEQQRHQEALEVLRPLAESHPDQTDVLFLIGLSAMAVSQQPSTSEQEKTALLNEAVSALHTILVSRPALVRVRLELARAFFLQGEDDLARQHFEHVLAGNPHQAVRNNVLRFLQAIKKRRRLTGYFGFSFAPDSNISNSSSNNVIYIYNLPFRTSEQQVSSGVGFSMWAGGEYQHPLREDLRLLIGGDLSRQEHQGGAFDQTNAAIHLGPRWLAGPRTELSLLAEARQNWQAGSRNSRDLGLRVKAEHRLGQKALATFNASWHDRKYQRSQDRDGPLQSLAMGATYRFSPTIQGKATAGYTSERPATLRYRNSGKWIRLEASHLLPKGFTISYRAEQRWTDFQGNWGFFTLGDSTERKDRTRIYHIGVLNRAFTVFGFSPQLSLTNEERKSTAQLHDYKSNRTELQFIRQF